MPNSDVADPATVRELVSGPSNSHSSSSRLVPPEEPPRKEKLEVSLVSF